MAGKLVGGEFSENKPEDTPLSELSDKELAKMAEGINHEDLHELPEGPPAGWMTHILGLIRGRIPIDPDRDLHFLWHVAGWALRSIDPHDVRSMMFGVGSPGIKNAGDNLENHPDDPKVIYAACRQLSFKIDEMAPPE